MKTWIEKFDKEFTRVSKKTGEYRDDWFLKEHITSKQMKAFIEETLNEERRKVLELIAEEIIIAQREGEKTSRLTSLGCKLHNIYETKFNNRTVG